MAELELRFLALYPERMNIYADRGNVLFLQRRCEWRGISFRYAAARDGEAFDPDEHDLIYIGGGQDRDQRLVADDLRKTKTKPILDAILGDACMLAVCGGFQLLGGTYQVADERMAGAGVLDMETVRDEGRLIGNVAIEVDLGSGPRVVTGFENHGGRTYLAPELRPFGRVLSGHGNNGTDHTEGAQWLNLFGTYLHGPLLPKNAWLADELIARALSAYYKERIELDPLPDTFESAAHAEARRAAERD